MSYRQGFQPTTSTTSVSGSGVAWNPAALSPAQATLTSGQTTQNLRATGFGLHQLGDNDTIQGIEVTVTRHDANGTGAVNDVVQLVHNGSPVGIQKSGSGPWPSSPTAVTYGGTGDTWSTSLTGANIKDPSFGVQLYAFLAGPGTANPRVSQITIRVTYLQVSRGTSTQRVACCGCECGCEAPKTRRPVQYDNGEIELAVTDLAAGGFGHAWGHERIYSNRLSRPYDGRQGFGWLVRGWPYLVQPDATTFVFMQTTDEAVWFDYNACPPAGNLCLSKG